MTSNTKESILEAARDVYLTRGLSGLSMRAVAREVGVSATALYRHFDSKESMMAAVCDDGFRLFFSYLMRALHASTPLARFTKMTGSYLDFAIDHPRYYEVLFMSPREHLAQSQIGSLDVDDTSPTFTFLVDRVRECVDAGVFRSGDPVHIAYTVWAQTHGLSSLFLRGLMRQEPDEFRAFYNASIERMVNGLAVPT